MLIDEGDDSSVLSDSESSTGEVIYASQEAEMKNVTLSRLSILYSPSIVHYITMHST